MTSRSSMTLEAPPLRERSSSMHAEADAARTRRLPEVERQPATHPRSATASQSPPVAAVTIVGCGLVSPLGDSPEAIHAALCEGVEPTTEAARLELDEAIFGGGNLRPLDRAGRLAIAAAQHALDDAGWTRAHREATEVGLVHGTLFGCLDTVIRFDRRALEAGPRYVKPFEFANTVINAAAGQTAIWHHLRGLNSTVAGGGSVGLEAVATACDHLIAGRGDAVLAGGGDAWCDELQEAFAERGALASQPPIPFGDGRDGVRLGESAAYLALERRRTDAAGGGENDASAPSVEILGQGLAFDPSRGRSVEAFADAMARAQREALGAASLAPETVDLVAVSACGDPRLDASEARALDAVFGTRARDLPWLATRPALGVAFGADGGLQLAIAAQCLRTRMVPPTPDAAAFDPALPKRWSARRAIDLGPRTALVHAAGHDGKSCALVLSLRTFDSQETDRANL
ncbi:MAG: beta-ketoacyl synthase N-terminal-like domain-containing protein [Acidobacteriota bacterium]